MAVEDFLNSFGMGQSEEKEIPEQGDRWDDIIKPSSSYLVLGDVGAGKSGLAHWLLERFSKKYSLLPAVVGYPRDKQALLPSDFIILDEPRECTKIEDAIVFIDEADLQLPMDDSKLKRHVINFLSLPRHRNQIFILAFHFPRLTMGTYLPFFSAFLLKRPPYLLEFAGKDQSKAVKAMMEKAEERFAELPIEDIVSNTYVVAPRIRWQGMLPNPLPNFWTEDLSKAWSGVDTIETEGKQTSFLDTESPHSLQYGKVEKQIFRIDRLTDELGNITGFNIIDTGKTRIKPLANLVETLRSQFPDIGVEVLEKAEVEYSDDVVAFVRFAKPVVKKRIPKRPTAVESLFGEDWEPPPTIIADYWKVYHALEEPLHMTPAALKLKKSITEFCDKEGYAVNPTQNLDKHCLAMISMGPVPYCPWAKSKTCPCYQVKEEGERCKRGLLQKAKGE